MVTAMATVGVEERGRENGNDDHNDNDNDKENDEEDVTNDEDQDKGAEQGFLADARIWRSRSDSSSVIPAGSDNGQSGLGDYSESSDSFDDYRVSVRNPYSV